MKFNEFKIEEFKGLRDSFNVNPPDTAKNIKNVELTTNYFSIQPRFGTYLTNFNPINKPSSLINYQILAGKTLFVEKYDTEFIFLAVSETYDSDSSPLFNNNYKHLAFYVYPTLDLINGNYQIVNRWEKINQFCFLNFESFEYDTNNFARILKFRPYDNSDEDLLRDDCFNGWTLVVIDKNTFKVKRKEIILHSELIVETTKKILITIHSSFDDYNIDDFYLVLKNYVDIPFWQFNGEKIGLINDSIEANIIDGGIGLNVLTDTNPMLKLNFNDDVILSNDFEYYEATDGIINGSFELGFNYWLHNLGNSVSIIEDPNILSQFRKKCLKINNVDIDNDRNYFRTNYLIPTNTLNTYSLRFYAKTNNNYVNGSLSLIIVDESNNILSTIEILNSATWKEYVTDFASGNENIYLALYGSIGSNVEVYIDEITLSILKPASLPSLGGSFVQDKFIPNEIFRNNGGYVDVLAFNPQGIETYYNDKIYNAYIISKYSNTNYNFAIRIIQENDFVNWFVLGEAQIGADSDNTVVLYLNLIINFRRLTNVLLLLNKYTGILQKFENQQYIKRETSKILLSNGFLSFGGLYDDNEPHYTAVQILGYEPEEKLITYAEKGFFEKSLYVFDAKSDDLKKYLNSIYYSAININGAYMYDIIPRGNLIKLSDKGGKIKAIAINSLNGLIILKEKSVYLLDLNSYQLNLVSEVDGCISSNSLVVIGNEFIWADSNGIKISNGVRVNNLSDGLFRNKYLAESNKENFCGAFNIENQSYLLCKDDLIYSIPINYPELCTVYEIPYAKKLFTSNSGVIYAITNTLLAFYGYKDNIFYDATSPQYFNIVYETNDFDVASKISGATSNSRIYVYDIFIELENNTNINIDFSLIGDDYEIKTFAIGNTNRKIWRFLIGNTLSFNQFKRVRLKVSRVSSSGSSNGYLRIYKMGFTFLIEDANET